MALGTDGMKGSDDPEPGKLHTQCFQRLTTTLEKHTDHPRGTGHRAAGVVREEEQFSLSFYLFNIVRFLF